MTSAFSPFGLLGVPAARPPLCSPGLDPRGIFATFAVQPLIFLSHFGACHSLVSLLSACELMRVGASPHGAVGERPASSALGLATRAPAMGSHHWIGSAFASSLLQMAAARITPGTPPA